MKRRQTLAGAALVIAATLLAVPLLTAVGFTSSLAPLSQEDETPSSVPPSDAPVWREGRWWAFNVTLQEEHTFKAAIIVHDATEDGFKVGMNRSGDVLGLPFSGNFTDELNPEFAGGTWRMYAFPLTAGDGWDQELLGYTLNTTVSTAQLEAPGTNETTPGYVLEATAYRQTVASYTYHPTVGWFTDLMIRDPATGETVLDARLTAYGDAWGKTYYIKEALHEEQAHYPADLPTQQTVEIPDRYDRATAHLTTIVSAGAADAEVESANGASIARTQVLGTGQKVVTATVKDPANAWTFRHTGTGNGTIHLEVFGEAAVSSSNQASTTETSTSELANMPPPPDTLLEERTQPTPTKGPRDLSTRVPARPVSPWQILEHTADVGLTVQADTLEDAIADTIEGYGQLVCPDGEIEPSQPWQLQIESDALDDLLVDALDEINYIHQTQRFLPGACDVMLDETQDGRLRATLRMRGETYDPDKHGHLMEIKATTYHELVIERDPPRIQVIFDV